MPARLALAPEPAARARVEMDLARLDRGLERLGIHPGEHQHPAVDDVLDHGRHQPVRAEPDLGHGSRGRHAAPSAAGTSRTGTPSAASAALTPPIVWTRR